jgi:uracil-DNA glycosylase
MSKTDLKDIQQKLYERLKPSGWANKLKGFILSVDFYNILEELQRESEAGVRFTPAVSKLFRAFEECPYSELKVIMIMPDPYSKAFFGDGLALSCTEATKPDQKMPKALFYFLREIERTVYDDGYTYNPDLTRIANQGVLLLNAGLTTRIGLPRQHTTLWKPFITYLLDTLDSDNTGLVYVFLDEEPKQLRNHIKNKNNFKFFIPEPGRSVYRNLEYWDSGDIFNRINKILMNHYKTKIAW